MDLYNIATIWLLVGIVVYMSYLKVTWTAQSEKAKKGLLTFVIYVLGVLSWPFVLYIVVNIIISVEVEFYKWRKKNGF